MMTKRGQGYVAPRALPPPSLVAQQAAVLWRLVKNVSAFFEVWGTYWISRSPFFQAPARTNFTQECIQMLGPLVVVALGYQLPWGRQPVTARAAGVAMSGRQDAETYLKSTTDPDAKVALDDATRDAEPRLDGRVDDPAAKPTAAQSQAYQAALESGPPSGSVPVAYQSTAPPQAQPETAYDRFMRAKAASPPVVAGPVGWSPPADTAAAVATPESPLK